MKYFTSPVFYIKEENRFWGYQLTFIQVFKNKSNIKNNKTK